jgi:peptide/nickel transport system permease protein
MVIIGIIAAAIGTVVGAVSGYFRGWIDAVLMRLTDFIITIPAIIIGSVIGYHFGNLGATFLAFYLGLFAWTGLSRLIRGEFLTLREREFVDAARVAGASDRRIIFKHILPNAIGVIIVSVTLLMSGAILLETGLSYLGFGVVAPDVSLGLLVSTYQESFTIRPWLFWWPPWPWCFPFGPIRMPGFSPSWAWPSCMGPGPSSPFSACASARSGKACRSPTLSPNSRGTGNG